MNAPRKTACFICFIVILILTIALCAVLCYLNCQNGIARNAEYALKKAWKGDIIFSCAIATVLAIQEWVLYKCTSYFWAAEVKTPRKTCLYIVLLIIDLAFLVHEAIIFLLLFYQTIFG